MRVFDAAARLRDAYTFPAEPARQRHFGHLLAWRSEGDRDTLGDVRDVPTLTMPYGNVPIVHASAAMRRVAALAYLLVLAFREHTCAREFLGKKPERRIIFLIDEIEAHLHPR